MKNNELQVFNDKLLKLLNKQPSTIGIELTTHCPLDCLYCTRRWNRRRDEEIKWEEFIKIKQDFNSIEKIVLCGIGEPFVYSRIYDVLEELKDKKVIIITSGTVKIDFERLNKHNNVEVLIFSVDYPSAEGMIKISGGLYNWSNLLYNLNKNGNKNMVKMINCTVTENNYMSLTDLVQFAIDHELQAVSYTKVITHTEDEELTKELEDKIQEQCEIARKIAAKKRLVFTDSFSTLKCICWGGLVPYIDLNGEFYTCCQGMNLDKSIGNVFEKSFDEIIKSDAYKSFMCGDICFNNCSIYKDKINALESKRI